MCAIYDLTNFNLALFCKMRLIMFGQFPHVFLGKIKSEKIILNYKAPLKY